MVWLKQRLQAKFNAHHVTLQDDVTVDMNLIQSALNCCGVQGMSDWTTLDLAVPSSCCASGLENCDTRIADNVWPQGCFKQMDSFIDHNIGLMSLLVLSFAAVTLLGVFCSFSYAKKFSSSYERIE